jgi:hypothetical protein
MKKKALLPLAILAAGVLVFLTVQPLIGTNRIDVHVSTGLAPVISWSPPRELSSVQVHKGVYEPGDTFESSQIVWWIEASGDNPIGSPIEYGAALPGSRVIHGPISLVEGETYTAYLLRSDHSFSGDGNAYEAVRTFIVTK